MDDLIARSNNGAKAIDCLRGLRSMIIPNVSGAHSVADYPDHMLLELQPFWRRIREATLCEEVPDSQWGLVICSPQECHELSLELRSERPEDARPNDIVAGRFLGDTELVVLSEQPEGGIPYNIQIALPMDPRRDWPIVAGSLAEFLDRYMSSCDKWWGW